MSLTLIHFFVVVLFPLCRALLLLQWLAKFCIEFACWHLSLTKLRTSLHSFSFSSKARFPLEILWLKLKKVKLSSTESVTDLQSWMIISEPLLTTFESNVIFWGNWGRIENCFMPKTKLQLPSLTKSILIQIYDTLCWSQMQTPN